MHNSPYRICETCSTLNNIKNYPLLIDKFNDAINFLECHPALGGSRFTFHDSLWYSVQKICKNGYTEPHNGKIDIRPTKENLTRYKKEFDKEFKQYSNDKMGKLSKCFARISISYEKHFGESWKFDHIEWWGELGFKIFFGKDTSKIYEEKGWQNYQGIETNGKSYEEMIINCAEEFKKYFGDFSEEDFLTKIEIENHKKYFPFNFEKDKKNKNYSILKSNNNYIHISSHEYNRRWVKWYLKTEHCKKNWSSLTIQQIERGNNE